MIRLRNAILAVVASLFATGALAQGFTQDSERATVAEELFGGSAVKLEFGAEDFTPKAKLIFGGATAAAATIMAGTEFDVTLTLGNATFAEPVSNSDFRWGSWGPANTARGGLDCDTATTGNEGADDVEAGTGDDPTALVFCDAAAEVTIKRDGGGKNTNSVTFTVTVGTGALDNNVVPMLGNHDDDDATPDDYAGTTRKIVFDMPDLNASGLRAAVEGRGGVNVTASWSIEQTKSGGTVIMESVVDNTKCGGVGEGKAPVSCTIIDAAKVVTGITASAGGGEISLVPADERSVLVGGNGKAVDPQRALLANVAVAVAPGFGGAKDQDGEAIDGFTGDLSGSLAIRVSSDSFNEGDVVYIDSNGNRKVDGREAFEMDNGAAMDTVPLSSSSMNVYYVPSGDHPLTHRTTFTTTANTEFADSNAMNRSSRAVTAELELFGIRPGEAKAYAIAPGTSTDESNIRVTCETAGKDGCNVFLDCHDTAGMNTFGEAGMMIGPNATEHLTQMEIQDALGLDESWSGRLSCDVLSSAPISVQVLTRANGVLVNNTSVNEGGN
ncbi:MAG: hypothetical protein OXH52_12200 [Gammaproteobacteria bacterium]|nr:hypothetical protein [Gammaproteobacteria bacterium]